MQKCVGIFGGSFDPPHNGHLAIMESAIAQLGLHQLFIVPSFLNPFKTAFCFAPNLRLKWMQQLAKGLKSKGCSSLFLKMPKPEVSKMGASTICDRVFLS